jgi:hypothetical protein
MGLLIIRIIIVLLETPPAIFGSMTFFATYLTGHVYPWRGAASTATTTAAPSRWCASTSLARLAIIAGTITPVVAALITPIIVAAVTAVTVVTAGAVGEATTALALGSVHGRLEVSFRWAAEHGLTLVIRPELGIKRRQCQGRGNRAQSSDERVVLSPKTRKDERDLFRGTDGLAGGCKLVDDGLDLGEEGVGTQL